MQPARLWALALVAGTLGAGTEAVAQASMGGAPRFELGVYGGGAYSSDWFETRRASSTAGVITEQDDGDGYGIGSTPAFGGTATWYMSPMWGLRLHYGFLPSALPQGDDSADFDDDYPQNNHLYDIDLVFRPWAAGSGGFLAQTYLFLGGGALTTDVASTEVSGEDNRCEPGLLSLGACLPLSGEAATVGQGVVGLGFDLFAFGPLGVFAEVAAHGYDSPVHVGDDFIPRVQVTPGQSFNVSDDAIAVTARYVAGVKMGFGSFMAPVAPVAVAPAPAAPRPAPAPAPAAPPAPAERAISVCVVEGASLTNVQAMFNPTSRDTTVNGQRFATRYPATAPAYASGASWFTGSDALRFNNTDYVRFGVSRVIQPAQLTRSGEFNGTGVFVESGVTAPYAVVYVPVRPGCEFQPYQPREAIRVRG